MLRFPSLQHGRFARGWVRPSYDTAHCRWTRHQRHAAGADVCTSTVTPRLSHRDQCEHLEAVRCWTRRRSRLRPETCPGASRGSIPPAISAAFDTASFASHYDGGATTRPLPMKMALPCPSAHSDVHVSQIPPSVTPRSNDGDRNIVHSYLLPTRSCNRVRSRSRQWRSIVHRCVTSGWISRHPASIPILRRIGVWYDYLDGDWTIYNEERHDPARAEFDVPLRRRLSLLHVLARRHVIKYLQRLPPAELLEATMPTPLSCRPCV